MPARKKAKTDVVVLDAAPVREVAFGGGVEGAERTTRETALWTPSMRSPDQVINGVKDMADARGADMVRNDGYTTGAVSIHRDSIVGAQYRLNAQPNWRVLGASEGWAEEFQEVVEARFNLLADSPSCWLDAARMNTLTGMVRLVVGGFVITGEGLATAEWIREATRPYNTAIQLVAPARLSNPDGKSDTRTLRRGVNKDFRGRPLGYWIRKAYPGENYEDDLAYQWAYIPAEKPWGRKQVIHIIEQLMPDQSRGIADMVSALKSMRMTKKFRDITLQNAVVNASYAAAIESELPPEVIYGQFGGGEQSFIPTIAAYMKALEGYLGGARNIAVDGVKIPHLFPGTKLNLKPMGTPGGVGSQFEESLLRHTAASLGVSYEELARDYSKTSYSSARTSMTNTWKFMQSRKKVVADRFASAIYTLVLEEMIAKGDVPLPTGKKRDHFYEPLMRDAYAQATWIGASRGQVDELKETQAAILRIKAGLSTYEEEVAKLGKDYREVFAQRAREEGLIKAKGLAFSLDAQREGKNQTQQTLSDNPASGTENDNAATQDNGNA